MSQSYRIIRSNGAGFTWNQKGECHGVTLERTETGCRVSRVWHGQASEKSGSIGEALAKGRHELKLREDTYIAAGPSDGGWGMCEVTVPKLRPQELRGALGFELKKYAPFSLESLSWGYRILPVSEDQEGQLQIRLFYVKKETWRKWIGCVSGLGTLDAVLPPLMGLDSLLDGKNVTFAGDGSFEYISVAGKRQVRAVEGKATEELKKQLPIDGLDFGELEKLPAQEQAGYLSALILGLYVMGRDYSKDESTLHALPNELYPHRFFACKMACGILGCLMAIILVLGFVRGMQQRGARLRQLKSEVQMVEKELKVLQKSSGGNRKAALGNLELELGRYIHQGPDMPEVLAELTRLISSPAWLGGAFEWNRESGTNMVSVSFVAREPAGDLANLQISTKLNRSPILGDVSENKTSQGRGGFIERKFVLKARYDTPEEKKQLAKDLAQEAAQAKAAAAAKEAASKEAAAKEAASKDTGNEGEQGDN